MDVDGPRIVTRQDVEDVSGGGGVHDGLYAGGVDAGRVVNVLPGQGGGVEGGAAARLS